MLCMYVRYVFKLIMYVQSAFKVCVFIYSRAMYDRLCMYACDVCMVGMYGVCTVLGYVRIQCYVHV